MAPKQEKNRIVWYRYMIDSNINRMNEKAIRVSWIWAKDMCCSLHKCESPIFLESVNYVLRSKSDTLIKALYAKW